MDIVAAIEQRHSIRRYDGRPVPREIVQQVTQAGRNAVALCPEIATRWYIVWEGSVLAKHLSGPAGVYGIFTSAPHYVIAVSEERPGFMENMGFRMEQLILQATAVGLGTCWIGGLFTEETLQHFIPDLGHNERIMAITPLGYADLSPRANLARRVIRWGTELLGRRKSSPEVVSQDIWLVPWNEQDEILSWIFYLTRLAPSWGNTQPWHFVVDEQRVIATVNNTPQKGNVREGKAYYRMDGGIAMCHFYLAAQAARWPTDQVNPPGWRVPTQAERSYLRSRYRIPKTHEILGVYPTAEPAESPTAGDVGRAAAKSEE
jgi:nitroreductase